MRPRELSTRVSLIVYTGTPRDLGVNLHSDSCSHQQAAEHVSPRSEGFNSVPAPVRTLCMAAESVCALLEGPIYPTLCHAIVSALLDWPVNG